MVEITYDTIYIQEWTPDRVLKINTKNGSGVFYDGTLKILTNCRGGTEYFTGGNHSVDATQSEIILGLGKAICSLNEKMNQLNFNPLSTPF